MSEVWNKVYKSDKTFFGEEPSNFALLCLHIMKTNNVGKVLELGAGHGRDTILFASNGTEVEALDYSAIAVEILDNITKEKRLPIKSQFFDAARFHFQMAILMLLNMCFSLEDLHFIFSEISRVLKPKEFNFFSVRNQNDSSCGKGIEIEKEIYDIDGLSNPILYRTENT
jgi:SAM-dependent methyltransferase